MPHYVDDPDNRGKKVDVYEIQRRDPSRILAPDPRTLDPLLKRDTWARREAIAILAGYDPHPECEYFYAIPIPHGYMDGTSDTMRSRERLPHPLQEQFLSDCTMLAGYAQGEPLDERKPPSEWIAWAESKGFAPHWRRALEGVRMEFISLGEALRNMADCINMPPHFNDTATDIGAISRAAADEFWKTVNPRIEFARRFSHAALMLNKALHDSDAPLQWMEFDEAKRFAVRAGKQEGIEMLTHATGWGSRELENCSVHFRNAITQGDDTLATPVVRGTDDGQIPAGKMLRLVRIGFDRAKLITFLDDNEIAHKLEPQSVPVVAMGIEVSEAPEPIKPLPDRPMVLPPNAPIPSPEWDKWQHMQDVELWEAVALTVNLEPDEMPVYLGAYDAHGDNPFRICPREFQERLQIAVSNCGTTFPCKPVHRLRARSVVDLPAFGAWAAGVWNDLPHEFPIATPVAKERASVGVQPARRIHSTKTRRDLLTPVIELAQSRCRDPKDTPQVWAALLVLAEHKSAPLIGATEEGLQYFKDGTAGSFNRDALDKRLKRQ